MLPKHPPMKCTSCGSEAVVKRGESFFCGTCAITQDWQELIAVVQDARIARSATDVPDAQSA